MSIQPDDVTAPEAELTTPAPVSKRLQTGVVRVNLIPAELAQARQLKVVAMGIGAVAVLCVAALAAGYQHESGKVNDAKTELATAQTQSTKLNLEVSRLGNVDALYAKVDAAEAMLKTAEAPQILWSRYLEDLRLQLPEHVWLTSLSATESGAGTAATGSTATAAGTTVTAAGATAATTGAATPTTIGTLTFAGGGYTHNDVASLLDKLAGLHAVTNPFLSSSTEVLVGKGPSAVATVTWNATASLTSDALKTSYDGTDTP